MAAGVAGKKPEFEGWLQYLGPKGGFFKLGGWKKKWISLVGNECKIFDKQVPQGLGKPSATIGLQQINHIIGGKTGATRAGKENGFVVTYTPLNQSPVMVCFAADNAETSNKWVDQFLRCQKAVFDHMGTKYLRLRLISARNLKANDAGGTSDPYCVAKVGDLPEYKTEMVLKTLAPEWNENAVWILQTPSTSVHLTIYDWNRIGSDAPLGSLGFNVSALPSDGNEVVSWHPLTPPGSGEINLGVTVNGFSSGSGPEIDPVMDFYLKYVKRDASGKMVVQNLPEAWKMLFERAGTTDEQLKDPNTISVLVKVLHDALKDPSALDRDSSTPKKVRQKVICIATAEFDFTPVQEGDLELKIGDVIRVYEKGDNGWWKGRIGDREGVFPGNYVGNIKTRTKKNLPPKPDKPAPAPPAASPSEPLPPSEPAPEPPSEPAPEPPVPTPVKQTPTPNPTPTPTPPVPKKDLPPTPTPTPVAPTPSPTPTPLTPTPTPTPVAPTIPVAPPVPPAPPAVPTTAPTAPKPPPPPPVAAPSNERAGVLSSITAFDRTKLKKAESTPAGQRDLADLNDKQLNSLVGLLSNAMSGRRAHLKEDVDSEDDDDDDDDWE